MADRPILILGAGINGVAAARQLLLNGQSVALVDCRDLASGATAYSSRLIHGGLRYLEYGELGLVRESLRERTRLLRLAPHLVRPLQLFVPTESRFGGLAAAISRLLGWAPAPRPRGAWLVGCGLWLYDWIARGSKLPRHRAHRVGAAGTPRVDPQRYRWITSFYDGQVRFPERLVLAMLADGRRLATAQGLQFDVLTYHNAARDGDEVVLEPVAAFAEGAAEIAAPRRLRPRAVVNATGAWVDETLERLRVDSPRLMKGTKGSHLITANPALRELLAAEGVGNGGSCAGIYAEAADGRPVFVLPLGEACLIGTTDIPHSADPEQAVTTEEERQYLLDVVNRLFPRARLSAADIEFHYAGVRPLPDQGAAGSPAGVTRRHLLHEHSEAPWPLLSLIGGKLTTCRSLAEEVVSWLAERLSFPILETGRDRPFPGGGGAGWADASPIARGDEVERFAEALAGELGLPLRPVADAVSLVGLDAREILATGGGELLAGLPIALVEHILRTEYVTTLSDLVERRLMLLYRSHLSRVELTELARRMAELNGLSPQAVAAQVEQCEERLRSVFGKRVL